MSVVAAAPQVEKPAPHDLKGFKLVGILGKARAGKDTVANYLYHKKFDPVQELFVAKAALADSVKKVAAEVFGIELEKFYLAEKETAIPELGFSPRVAAQCVGTEAFRDIFGPWVWVARLHRELKAVFSVVDAVVVSDVRFANEVQWVLEQDGIIVYLTRDDAPEVAAHSSENVPDLEYAQELCEQYGGSVLHITNNGSVQDLYAEIEARLVPLLLPA